ncbi:hypothetical protein ABVE96_10235 [Lactiplantibacillus plantarum]|uniref:hypothetical protein n=1 Tax=Lactiplantibacillus plantarum TaxID=1590 RepID=UPI0033904A88
MAESNATQVILTDDGIKIIKAQNTADNATSGITNLNDPNLMSVIEKQYNISRFAGLTSQYNVIVQNAKDDGIDTTAITAAYNSLNKFMAGALADPNHASDIDRATYKKYLDVYNEELANIQSALQNSANNKFTSATNATSQAASTASQAFIQAQSAVDYANSAINADKVTSQAVTDLKGGSTLTIQQLQDGIATKVESKDFASYQKQTADMFLSKVSKKDANNVNLIPYSAMPEADNLQWYGEGAGGTLSATTHAFYHNGADPLYELNTTSSTEVYAKSPRFKIKANTTYTFQLKGFASANVSSMDVFVLGRLNGDTSDYTVAQQIITGIVLSNSALDYRTVTFTTGAIDEAYLRIDNNGSTDGKISILGFTELKLEPGDTATEYIYSGQDSMISQLSDDINLRVTKDGLVDQINLQAGKTLISSSGQLTLAANTIYFDTNKPVIIPSANLDTVLVNKTLTAADITANTFSTNNGTFTVEKDGAITAKNMTLIGGTLTSPTINASTINGATLNMQTDGLINSPYNGVQQTADQFYHPWKLNTGQLTIGQGYITSVSSGTRSINGVPKQFDSLQGTLSASYLKFTNNYGARTYIDADMFTYSNQTNDTAMVKIDADGIGIDVGAMSAPALTVSNGYIDASSSSSYGVFGAITLGYSSHIINSDDSLFFESGHGSGNPGINIWAKSFQSMSSRLSTKRQVRLLDDEHSNSLLLGADTATFQYNQDTNADNPNEGVIIDDVNTTKQYNLPDELMTRDGKAPADLMSFIARIISQNKYQARLIEDLQIRLRKVEINNE